MLRTFVSTEGGIRRHLATPIGPYLDGYLSHLHAQGFASDTMHSALLHVTAFGEYLAGEGIQSVAEIDPSTLDAFVEKYRSDPRGKGKKRRTACGSESIAEGLRGSLRGLLTYLQRIGAMPPSSPATTAIPYGAVLEEYLAFLRVHRGFADLTVEQHRRWGTAFFARLDARRPGASLRELTGQDVESAVLALADGRGRRCRQILTTTVESLVRYLQSCGRIPTSCCPFLPRQKSYALASLPSAIPWEDVECTLAQMDRTTPVGQRDYALLVLLATYGLRASEVIGLRLNDLDWRGGVMHIRQTKTRRVLDLPLVPRAIEALVAYLRHARSKTADRSVFLKLQAPRGPLTRAALYAIVRKALRGAGAKAEHYGPHSLRHARATSLIRHGRSLKMVGDLLGHRQPESTLLYCKLAVEDLRRVALELPELPS